MSDAIAEIKLEHQLFIEKQKYLFAHSVKKALVYFVLSLLLLAGIVGAYVFIHHQYRALYATKKALMEAKVELLLEQKKYTNTQTQLLSRQLALPIYFPHRAPPLPVPPEAPVTASSPPVKASIQNICLAPYKKGVHPGILESGQKNKKTCAITYGSDVISLSQYKKLPKGNYDWASYSFSTDTLPKGAILGGQEPIVDQPNLNPYRTTRNLYICRVNHDNTHIGKLVDGVCNIPALTNNLRSTQFDRFEVLVKGDN